MKQTLLYLLLCIATILIYSCQDINSPELSIGDVQVGVQVIDASGRNVPGCIIRYAPKPTTPPSGLLPFGTGATSSSGILYENVSVPTTGLTATLQITPPVGVKSTKSSYYYPSVFIPCNDTVLQFQIDIIEEVDCNQQIGDINLETMIFCYEDSNKDTSRCTNFFKINCPDTSFIDIGPSTNFANLAIKATLSNGTTSTRFPLAVPPGVDFQLCFTLVNERNEYSLKNEILPLRVSTGSNPGYVFTNIIVSAESRCSNCKCYDNDIVFNFAKKYCISQTNKSETIDLKSFINSNKDCDVILQQTQQFSTGKVTLMSFNNNVFEINPSQRLTDCQVDITISQQGTIRDQAIYNIYLRDKTTQELTQCKGKLIIDIAIDVDAPGCRYVIPQNINNPIIIRGGIGVPIDTSTITIENTSTTCPLIIDNVSIAMTNPQNASAGVFRIIRPSTLPVTINPSGRTNFQIIFVPTIADVFPPDGKRTNARIDEFNATITFISNSSNCSLSPLQLKGIVQDGKVGNDGCVLEWGKHSGSPSRGIDFNTDGSIVSSAKNGTTREFGLYVSSINQTTGSAVLDVGSLNYLRIHKLTSTASFPMTDVCQFTKLFSNSCDLAKSGTTTVTVSAGDVLLLHYSTSDGKGNTVEYCTSMVISQVGPQPSNPNIWRVCYDICAGL